VTAALDIVELILLFCFACPSEAKRSAICTELIDKLSLIRLSDLATDKYLGPDELSALSILVSGMASEIIKK
jgi:hypothetical protein